MIECWRIFRLVPRGTLRSDAHSGVLAHHRLHRRHRHARHLRHGIVATIATTAVASISCVVVSGALSLGFPPTPEHEKTAPLLVQTGGAFFLPDNTENDQPVPVPEPSTLWIALPPLLATLWLHKRRKPSYSTRKTLTLVSDA